MNYFLFGVQSKVFWQIFKTLVVFEQTCEMQVRYCLNQTTSDTYRQQYGDYNMIIWQRHYLLSDGSILLKA